MLLFAAAITILTGLFTGLAPMFTAGMADLVSALKDSSRSSAGRGGQTVAERAGGGGDRLTLVLAFAAGLLLRNLIAAADGGSGLRSRACAGARTGAAVRVLQKPAGDRRISMARLERDLHGLPGVTAVGAVNCPPSAGDCGDWFYSILDRPAPQPAEVPIALFNTADRDYFGAMRIPLRQGRAFNGGRPGRRAAGGDGKRDLRAQVVAE